MENNTYPRMAILASVLTASVSVPSMVSAAGFQLVDHSAVGLGRAYAGDAALADNAAAIARNPALSTYFSNPRLAVGLTYINPNVDTEGRVSSLGAPGSIDADKKDFADSAFVPNAYWVQPLNDRWSWGVALNTHFGLKTEYGGDYAASDVADEAEVISYNINPSIGYRYNNDLRVGAGVSVVKAEAVFGLSLPSTGGNLLKVEGDDWGFGWNIGAVWQASETWRFALAYRSKVDLVLEGDAVSDVAPSLLAGPGSVDLTLPAGAEFSAVYQFSPQWMLSASAQWTDWSSFEQLILDYDSRPSRVLKDEYFEDNMRYAIGITYQASPVWTWRVGLALDEAAATAEYRSLSIPDSDRHWYSAGFTYQVNGQLSVDAGVTILKGEKETVEESSSIGSNFVGSSEGHADIASISLNYSF